MNNITEKEVWKPVKGYEGRYEVSNFGRVKSLDRKVKRLDIKGRPSATTVKGRILKPNADVIATGGGYPTVKLMIDNKGKTVKVHRLVAIAFIENPNNYSDVNHKDEVKTNNHVNNLEWCTRFYNNEYGTRKERIYSHPNVRNKVRGTCLKTGKVLTFNSMSEAIVDGFYSSRISEACSGKSKSYKGYKWEKVK